MQPVETAACPVINRTLAVCHRVTVPYAVPASVENEEKALVRDERFGHVMALTLDRSTGYREGVIRCITSREGDVKVGGYVDRSELHIVSGESLNRYSIGERLAIRGEDEFARRAKAEGYDFLGFEDPDIFIDERGLTHLYFTIPLIKNGQTRVDLGHAVGKDLHSLEMTAPVLTGDGKNLAAKEVCIAPRSKKGVRFNLVESSSDETDFAYSVVKVAVADDMGKRWSYGATVFHPKEHGIPWIAGHASPGPLLPRSFIDIGEGRLVGLMNGREANRRIGDSVVYGTFSVGLFIYNYEEGKIEWVSPRPVIQDTEAQTITFASQFIDRGNGAGVLYAHVDDSFVRSYTLDAGQLKQLLPPGGAARPTA